MLGLWHGNSAGESAKFAMFVLTDLKNRGVADVFLIVCDGLKGLPESVGTVFKETIVQTCILHLIRGTFRYAAEKYWEAIARDLRPIYRAATADAAWAAFESSRRMGQGLSGDPATVAGRVGQFIRSLAYDLEIREVLCSTNTIESWSARYRRPVNAKGHFPTEQAALKTLYLVTRSLDPKGLGRARWVTRWKLALNALAITFADRMPAAENL